MEYAAHDVTTISSKAILVMTLPSAIHLINNCVQNNLEVRREDNSMKILKLFFPGSTT